MQEELSKRWLESKKGQGPSSVLVAEVVAIDRRADIALLIIDSESSDETIETARFMNEIHPILHLGKELSADPRSPAWAIGAPSYPDIQSSAYQVHFGDYERLFHTAERRIPPPPPTKKKPADLDHPAIRKTPSPALTAKDLVAYSPARRACALLGFVNRIGIKDSIPPKGIRIEAIPVTGPGFSGGPVVNSNGEAIGLLTGGDPRCKHLSRCAE